MVKPLRISQKVIESARNTLEEDHERGPIVIAENVSLEQFLKYCQRDKLPARIQLVDGRVAVYEIPSELHGVLVMHLGGEIRSWNNIEFRGFADIHMIVGPNTVYSCDAALQPRRLPQPAAISMDLDGYPFPTMVVEVGKAQTFPDLCNKATSYFSPYTTIQIYLAIKVFDPQGNGARAMVALLYLRTNPNPLTPAAISFGTSPLHHTTLAVLQNVGAAVVGVGHGGPPCNGPGIPIYQLHFPSVNLFNGVPGGVPVGMPVAFNLDLWDVQVEATEDDYGPL